MARPKARASAAVLCLAFLAARAASGEESASATGRLTGRVPSGAGATVAFFDQASGPAPDPARYFRVPDSTTRAGRDGSFSANLRPGRYWLGAVRRTGAGDRGPPMPGDSFWLWRDAGGRPAVVEVVAGRTADAGRPGKPEAAGRRADPERPVTAIEGRVVAADGRPIRGVFVVARRASVPAGRPQFVSYPTGHDGLYSIRVEGAGEWLLGARSTLGGPPTAGSAAGDHPVAVTVPEGGSVRGIDVVATPFPGRGPESR